MALPSPVYIECPNLQNYFIDKDTAQAMSGGAVWFYSDINRTTLKPIYQQVRLPDNTYEFVELNNPVTLTSIGTFADDNGNDINVYLYPYVGLPTDAVQGAIELYFIEVYNADETLQFTREAYPPNLGSNTNPEDIFEDSTNILSNPQFAEINFTPDPSTGAYIYNVSGSNTVSNLAPDWDLVTTGTGTVTVKQFVVADQDAPSNPPYALDIQAGGSVTSLHLRQRIYNSPRLLKDSYVSGYFVAETQDSQTPVLSLYYMPSASASATTQLLIAQDTLSATGFTEVFNETAVAITLTNTDNANTGYVDFYLDIPVTAHVQVSSFQIASVQNAQSSVKFIPESVARQIDHTYHDAYPIVPVGAFIDFGGFTAPLHYLLCDGAAYNRVTYKQLFNVITTTESVSLTSTVTTFTVASAANYRAGMSIEGAGVPASTTISSISGLTITMSNPASSTTTSIIRFFLAGAGDGSATFNVPNLVGKVIAGADGTLLGSGDGLNGPGASSSTSTITLIAANLPPHSHTIAKGSSDSSGGAFVQGTSNDAAATTNTGNGPGASTAFSIVQPTYLLRKYIRYE